MKRLLCALAALLLFCTPAHAQTAIESSPQIIIELVTPSAPPAGETFSNEDLIITLPYGMHIMGKEARTGFEAALQAAYPDTARTLVAAADAQMQRALVAAIIPTDADALTSAQEAAESILGSSESVQELRLGENNFASFACAINGFSYYLYCLSDGEELLMVGVSGLSQQETETMLTALKF